MKKKIIRITTVPISLGSLLRGQLKYMTSTFDVIGVSSSNDNILTQVGKEQNIRVIPVEMTRKITPFKDLIALYKLIRILKKEKPFIVHSHTPKAGTIGMLAAKIAGVPHRLHTIAGLPLVEATGAKRILLNSVEKLTYSCATKIYPNSYGLNKIILDHNFTKPSKLKVIGNGSSNGINTTHFDPALYSPEQNDALKDTLKIAQTDFVFIYVGRFVKDKGTNELIASFVDIHKQFPHSKLLLVGGYENDLDPLSSATVHIINTHPAIISTGWTGDVRPYFAIANILVFPSYREGFPNVVMQSGAMGLFSIVSNINGCNEIIIPEENGTIIPVKDIPALTHAMKNAVENAGTITHNSKKIRQMIIDRYEQKFVWEALKSEYLNL
mgnify:CR=1 FL=1